MYDVLKLYWRDMIFFLENILFALRAHKFRNTGLDYYENTIMLKLIIIILLLFI